MTAITAVPDNAGLLEVVKGILFGKKATGTTSCDGPRTLDKLNTIDKNVKDCCKLSAPATPAAPTLMPAVVVVVKDNPPMTVESKTNKAATYSVDINGDFTKLPEGTRLGFSGGITIEGDWKLTSDKKTIKLTIKVPANLEKFGSDFSLYFKDNSEKKVLGFLTVEKEKENSAAGKKLGKHLGNKKAAATGGDKVAKGLCNGKVPEPKVARCNSECGPMLNKIERNECVEMYRHGIK
jgi:hypothetical protein